MAGNVSVKQLERQCDLVAGKVEKQVARVEKAKATLREARAELAQLRAEQKETRTRLAEARKAGGGRAGGLKAADEEE
jgi:flagellar biosynthesis chaperone FliJ